MPWTSRNLQLTARRQSLRPYQSKSEKSEQWRCLRFYFNFLSDCLASLKSGSILRALS